MAEAVASTWRDGEKERQAATPAETALKRPTKGRDCSMLYRLRDGDV